jgi:hypothetical protein
MAALDLIVGFIVAWIISALIIYVVVKIFGEKEGFGTTALTALIGSINYTIAYFLLGLGLLAAILAGIAWLIALGTMYKMGWWKSLAIAIVVWVVASLVSLVLPTLVGSV